MKTIHNSQFIMHNWLRPLALLAFFTLHSSLFISKAQAQEENAAFYIYQNDGHFDGFFYDQVEKIGYSKLDTLGIEHGDIVSQEIVTADSTYRIMLSAIDSVGFVQPEVKFNPSLKNMRELGMNAYLTSKDMETMTLTFSVAMPPDMRPRAGDVLVDFDIEDGFGGKVRTAKVNGNSWVVECDTIGMRDVFLQFITVEQQDQNKHGQLIRRRTAGLPQMDIDNRDMLRAPFRSKDTFEGNIFNFGFSGHLLLLDSADVSVTIDANINSALTVKGSYNIPMVGPYYIGLTFQNDLDFGLGLTVDAKLHEMKERQTAFKASVPIPAACPIFELRSVPGLFLKGDVHMKFSADLVKYRKRVWHKLEFNNDWLPTFNYGDAQLPELDDAIDKPWERDASIEYNGTIMAGIHGPLELGINSWLKKVLDASFGIHMYIGPKLSGALNFSLSNMYKDKMSAYNLLKDSKLSLQPCAFDYEATAELNTWFSGKKKVTLADGSANLMGDYEIYAFPDFSTDATMDDDNHVTATVTPSRKLFWPVTIGVGLFMGNTMYNSYMTSDVAYDAMPQYQSGNKVWEEKKSFSHQFYVSPGKYQVRPIFQLGPFDIVASPAKEIKVPGPYLQMITTDTLSIGCDGGTVNFDMETNCDSVDARVIWDYSYGITRNYPDIKYTLKDMGEEKARIEVEIPRHYSLRDSTLLPFYIEGYQRKEDGTYSKAWNIGKVCVIQAPNDKVLPEYINIMIDSEESDDGHHYGSYSSGGAGTSIDTITTTRNGNYLHVALVKNRHFALNSKRTSQIKVNINFDINLGSTETDHSGYGQTFTVENGTFYYERVEIGPFSGDDSKTEETTTIYKGNFSGNKFIQSECYKSATSPILYIHNNYDGTGTYSYSVRSNMNGFGNYYFPNMDKSGNLKYVDIKLFIDDHSTPWDGRY